MAIFPLSAPQPGRDRNGCAIKWSSHEKSPRCGMGYRNAGRLKRGAAGLLARKEERSLAATAKNARGSVGRLPAVDQVQQHKEQHGVSWAALHRHRRQQRDKRPVAAVRQRQALCHKELLKWPPAPCWGPGRVRGWHRAQLSPAVYALKPVILGCSNARGQNVSGSRGHFVPAVYLLFVGHRARRRKGALQ